MAKFRVVVARPGPDFVDVVRRERPEIAVLNGVDERPEEAAMEIEVLKAIQSEVRVIAISGTPTPKDAAIVELGVFYYLAGPPGTELVEVVEAASRSLAQTWP